MLPASPLKLQRLIRGLDQTAVAQALGVDQAKISKLERGRWLLGPTFRRLAAFYGLSPEPLRRRMVAWGRRAGRPATAGPADDRAGRAVA